MGFVIQRQSQSAGASWSNESKVAEVKSGS